MNIKHTVLYPPQITPERLLDAFYNRPDNEDRAWETYKDTDPYKETLKELLDFFKPELGVLAWDLDDDCRVKIILLSNPDTKYPKLPENLRIELATDANHKIEQANNALMITENF